MKFMPPPYWLFICSALSVQSSKQANKCGHQLVEKHFHSAVSVSVQDRNLKGGDLMGSTEVSLVGAFKPNY